MTPDGDDEDIYDNVPWQSHTYRAMLENDRRASLRSDSAAPIVAGSLPADQVPVHRVVTTSDSVNSSSSHTSATSSQTSAAESTTDSGISSQRCSSSIDANESTEATLQGVLLDLTPANLDQIESQMEPRYGQKDGASRPRKTRGLRTKKTRNGALNALSKLLVFYQVGN